MSIAAIRAWQMRRRLEANDEVSDEDLVMYVIPEDSEIKREEIFQKINDTFGREFDDESARGLITATLSQLCKDGVLVRVGHGVYKRVN